MKQATKEIVVGSLEDFKRPTFVLDLAVRAIASAEDREVLKDWMIENVPRHFDEMPWRPFVQIDLVGWLLWKTTASSAIALPQRPEFFELLRVEPLRLFAIGTSASGTEYHHLACEAWLRGGVPGSSDVFTFADIRDCKIWPDPAINDGRPVLGIQVARPASIALGKAARRAGPYGG